MTTSIIRKAQTGEPGNPGQFGRTARPDADTRLSVVEDRIETVRALAAAATNITSVTEEEHLDIAVIHLDLQFGSRATGRNLARGWLKENATEETLELAATLGAAVPLVDTSNQSASRRLDVRDSIEDAALALAHRHLIGADPRWSQARYDNLVRPLATVLGPLHPDDETHPASWATKDVMPALLKTMLPATQAYARGLDDITVEELPTLSTQQKVLVAEGDALKSVLTELGKDPSADVRLAVARNPDTDIDTLDTLADDEDEDVRFAAVFTLDS